jgi:hypothetical protein
MPRTTRAAARAQESDSAPQLVFEDAEISTVPVDAEETSPPTALPTRPIFGELTGNNIPTIEPKEQTVTIYAMPAKKVKSKKGRPATKKNKLELKIQTTNDNQVAAEVLEDENQSDTSDAADAATEELRRDERPSETFQVPMDNERPRTPPSAAAKEAMSTLLRSSNKDLIAMQVIPPNTPKFDPAVHKAEVFPSQPDQEQKADSFVEDITTRSPTKLTPQIEEQKEDSFVEAIITRSPTKTIPRIEDSVAEMDALDDAIEKVAEILPVLEERDLESPTITREVVKPAAVPSTKRKTALTTILATKPTPKAPKVHPPPIKAASGPTRPSTSRPSTVRAKPTARASVLPKQPRAVSADTSSSSLNRPGMSISASLAKAEPNTTQKIRKTSTGRSLSTSKPGFVPAKSTKATTTSSFTLPGEAVAAKLKTQREERQKREEEAVTKEAGRKVVPRPTTAPKERPRLSSMAAPAIKPRETKTSQARQSLMVANSEKRTASGTSNKENVAPSKNTGPKTTKDVVLKAKELAAKRKTSGVSFRTDVKDAGTMDAGSVRANSAIRRTGPTISTGATRKDSMVPSPSSESDTGAKKSTMNKADLVSQKGREVFGRDKMQKAEMDRARREKEDAAKKARADAAERGRIASREWAEKQKKRVAAASEAAKKQQAVVASSEIVASV